MLKAGQIRLKRVAFCLGTAVVLAFFVSILWILWQNRIEPFLFPIRQVKLETEFTSEELKAPNWPKSVEQAVEILANEMSQNDKTQFAQLCNRDLTQFHFGLGGNIRNRFGLWRGNSELMESTGKDHPDEASMAILEGLLKYLKSGVEI